MALSLPSLLFSYSLCWYGEFHVVRKHPTENVHPFIYYLSLYHLIISFTYLLFIHPLNMFVCFGSNLSNTAQESLVDEADHASDEMVNPRPNTASQGLERLNQSSKGNLKNVILKVFKVNKQTFRKNLQYHEETLMNRSFDDESFHRKARLTKSGSFPAPTSSHLRFQVPTKLDSNKQREIWPQSQGKESANANSSKNSSAKEIKRYVPRSIKLRSENDKPNPRVSRRGLSLSELEYNSFLPHMDELTTPIDCNRHEKPGSVLTAPCEEDEMFSTILFTSEGNFYEQSFTDRGSSNLDKGEIVENPEGDQFSHSEVADTDYNFEYYYVKLVLELSGLTRKGELYTWYSPEQLLDPDLFEEIEACYCELDLHKRSTKSEQTRWVREVIFDMINEALVYLNERPYLYYPKALSFKCHVYPIPRGQQLLDKVWTFVSRSLKSRLDLNSLLDSAVSHESNQIGGPMNLQIKSECAAMEVENLILDELLDEVLLACS